MALSVQAPHLTHESRTPAARATATTKLAELLTATFPSRSPARREARASGGRAGRVRLAVRHGAFATGGITGYRPAAGSRMRHSASRRRAGAANWRALDVHDLCRPPAAARSRASSPD